VVGRAPRMPRSGMLVAMSQTEPPGGEELFFLPAITSFRIEVSRKLLHLSTCLIPLVYWLVGRQDLMLGLLAVSVAIAVAVEVLRHHHAGFQRHFRATVGFMVREREWGRVSGATYVLVAALLSVWLFPRHVAIAGLLILSISDSAASLVGLKFGRSQFLGKSLAGSFAFFVTALGILFIALPEARGVAFLAAAVATVAEAIPALRFGKLELSDNILIPVCTGVAIQGLQAVGL